jgi:hypothetical protein
MDLTWNPKVTNLLQNLVKEKKTFPHLLLHGLSGSGKRTRIQVLLHEWSEKQEEPNVVEYKQQILIQTSRWVEVHGSSFHVDGMLDCLCTSNDLDVKTRLEQYPRLIVVKEADLLSSIIQQSLFYYLDSYMEKVRFIFITNHITRMLPALRSRTFMICLPLPRIKEDLFLEFPEQTDLVLLAKSRNIHFIRLFLANGHRKLAWQQEVQRLFQPLRHKVDVETLLTFVPIGTMFCEILSILLPYLSTEKDKKELTALIAEYEARCHEHVPQMVTPQFHIDALIACIQMRYPTAIKELSCKE